MDLWRPFRRMWKWVMGRRTIEQCVNWIREQVSVDDDLSWLNVALNVALIAFGFAMALWMLTYTGQIRFEKDAPAWVQAIGSIVAVFVAILVPAWQRARQNSDDASKANRQARSMASELLGETNELEQHLRIYREDLEHAIELKRETIRGRLYIPKGLLSARRDLHILGIPGDHLLSALYYAKLMNNLADGPGGLHQEDFEQAMAYLTDVEYETTRAVDEMEEMLE